MITQATVKIIDKQDLSFDEAYSVIDEIMSGQTTQIQTAAFLASLAAKGETVDEIIGCASAMREHALKVAHNFDVLEIVGTGGDRAGSFNISTTSSLVIAAAGQKIAKHGNRAASSKSGAADVLEALGVNISLEPEKCAELLNEAGICFLFAQKYHSSMKYVAPVRREMGVRTVFNILGPLTNPAKPAYQLMGVYTDSLLEPMAKILPKIGVKRGMVVYGEDVLDEISASAKTRVCEFDQNGYKTYELDPRDFGFELCDKSELSGGTPEQNAQITRDILSGAERGAKRTAVLLNSGAALYIAGKADSVKNGVDLAAQLIDSGAAARVLEKFASLSNI